jgi:hypothetical protein
MSVQATSWVWEHSKSEGSSRLVLLAIADAANREGGQSFQSAPSIARMTGLSVRTVWRCIDSLIEMGEITKEGRQGEYQTTVYALPAVSICHSVNLARRDTGGISAVPKTSTAVPPIGTQPHIPQKDNPKGSRLTDAFVPSELQLAWARKNTPDVDPTLETAQFIDHHIAKGSVMKDWGRAWQTWMRNQQKWSAPKQQTTIPANSPWSKDFHRNGTNA